MGWLGGLGLDNQFAPLTCPTFPQHVKNQKYISWRQRMLNHCPTPPSSILVRTAGYFTLDDMCSTLQILQLNVRKQSMVQQSLMNDEKLRDFGVLAITEPHVRKQGDTLVIVPTGHPNWTRMIPTEQEEGRWAVRSML